MRTLQDTAGSGDAEGECAAGVLDLLPKILALNPPAFAFKGTNHLITFHQEYVIFFHWAWRSLPAREGDGIGIPREMALGEIPLKN